MQAWDIIVTDEGGGRETVHGLTQAQSIRLMEIFRRHGIQAKAIEFDGNHEPTGKREAVNQ